MYCFQIDADTGQSDTYGELLKRCVRVARWLQERGVTKDHVVSLCTPNHLDTCVPFIACLMLGIKVASLDPSLSPGKIQDYEMECLVLYWNALFHFTRKYSDKSFLLIIYENLKNVKIFAVLQRIANIF